MGGDRHDRGQDRLHGVDAVELGSAGRARRRPGATTDEREQIEAPEGSHGEVLRTRQAICRGG